MEEGKISSIFKNRWKVLRQEILWSSKKVSPWYSTNWPFYKYLKQHCLAEIQQVDFEKTASKKDASYNLPKSQITDKSILFVK